MYRIQWVFIELVKNFTESIQFYELFIYRSLVNVINFAREFFPLKITMFVINLSEFNKENKYVIGWAKTISLMTSYNKYFVNSDRNK